MVSFSTISHLIMTKVLVAYQLVVYFYPWKGKPFFLSIFAFLKDMVVVKHVFRAARRTSASPVGYFDQVST